MKWQDMTAPQFTEAVADTNGVCIVPIGVLEKHGEHLPLGTDYLFGSFIAERAAEIEPAIVFPPYYFGQIHEAKHQPGTVAIRTGLMLQLLENVCQEIARNGLKKIILFNAHGGNSASLGHFLLASLEYPRDYTPYLIDLGHYLPSNDPQWEAMRQSSEEGHADELETSLMLETFPDLVRMENIGGDGRARQRLSHLAGLNTGISWYADYPDHYAGDAAFATREKGKFLVDYMTKKVADHIANVKRDTTAGALEREFHTRSQSPTSPA